MSGQAASEARRWGDLKARVLSALVMVAVGGVEIWLGGWSFAVLVVVVTAAMIWELARMTRGAGRDLSLGLGVLAALCLAVAGHVALPFAGLALLLPAAVGVAVPRRDRRIFAAYAVLIMLAGHSLVALRADPGIMVILWILLVVIASDVGGYFVGRAVGGPKFWPRVSPKKTWSGTIAGWIGAALVGLGFVLAGEGDWGLVLLSPLVALAAQMGDIAESWIKRRAGVKDSSNLIPGHGGVLDRFDGVVFAVVLVWALSRLTGPLFAGA